MRAGLVTLALLFASCGEKPVAPAKAHWDVIHTFGYDVKAARASPRTPPDATNEELLKQAVEVIARRLHVKDRADIGVWVSGPDTFQVGTRGLGPVELGGLPKLVVRRGTVEFLIEVRPDERYREFRSQGREPARSHVWPGTAAASMPTRRRSSIAGAGAGTQARPTSLATRGSHSSPSRKTPATPRMTSASWSSLRARTRHSMTACCAIPWSRAADAIAPSSCTRSQRRRRRTSARSPRATSAFRWPSSSMA